MDFSFFAHYDHMNSRLSWKKENKILRYSLAIILASTFLVNSYDANAAKVTVRGTVSLGSSMGLISNEAQEYSYSSSTKNIKILHKACPLRMGESVECIVTLEEEGGSITNILSATRPAPNRTKEITTSRASEGSNDSSPGAWQDAFSRRSYKLGMQLSTFKSIPYPDQKEWPGAYPVCSNDAGRLARVSPHVSSDLSYFSFKDLGVIKCMFVYEGVMGVDSAGLMLGDVSPASNEFLFFKNKGNKEPVLYDISAQFPAASFYSVVSSLQSYYGQPAATVTVDFVNGLGNQIKGQVVSFRNSSSQITVRQYSNDIRRGSISYLLNDLANEVVAENQRRNKRPGPP